MALYAFTVFIMVSGKWLGLLDASAFCLFLPLQEHSVQSFLISSSNSRACAPISAISWNTIDRNKMHLVRIYSITSDSSYSNETEDEEKSTKNESFDILPPLRCNNDNGKPLGSADQKEESWKDFQLWREDNNSLSTFKRKRKRAEVANSNDNEDEEARREKEQMLNAQIDAFLRGEYESEIPPNAPAPNPMLSPSDTIELSLRGLRKFNESNPSHAAVFRRFLAPLSRSERWGMSHKKDPWKQVLRGALTPTMLARRIRASAFSVLLDWESLSVTEGYFVPQSRTELLSGNTVAFVNAALFFGDGIEPSIVQFRLRKVGGAWLIDDATISKKELFLNSKTDDDS